MANEFIVRKGLISSGSVIVSGSVTATSFIGSATGLTGIFSASSQVDHDATTNFVANEHIDHTSVSITAGAGLSGGGTIAATRTLSVDSGSMLPYYSSSIFTRISGDITINSSTGVATIAANSVALGTDTTGNYASAVTAGNGITVGGTAGEGTSFSVTLDTGSTHFTGGVTTAINARGVFSASAQVAHDSTTGYSANRHIDHTAVSISAGSGMSGGGDISATRTLTLDTSSAHFTGGVTTRVNALGVFSSSAQVAHGSTTGYVANEHINHTSVSISAGSGMTGGGTIAATRTLTLDTGSVHFLDGVKKELNTEGVYSSSAQLVVSAYTNATDNRVVTSTGTGGINAEANLTFDGSTLTVTGALNATTKSFYIDHQGKPGKKLIYGVLEGPEHAVYVRGKLSGNIIILPEEWDWLVDLDSITVQLTPIGSHQKLYVESVDGLVIIIGNENLLSKSINGYYLVHATRKDVPQLKTVV